MMSDHLNLKPSANVENTEKRLEPFLDCLAFLLAKHWLREQRQQEEKAFQEQPGPQEDQPEK